MLTPSREDNCTGRPTLPIRSPGYSDFMQVSASYKWSDDLRTNVYPAYSHPQSLICMLGLLWELPPETLPSKRDTTLSKRDDIVHFYMCSDKWFGKKGGRCQNLEGTVDGCRKSSSPPTATSLPAYR